MKKELMTKCELAMMGRVVECTNEDVQEMTQYILNTIKGKETKMVDILKNAIQKYHMNEVKYIVCNTVQGMKCITYLLSSGVDEDHEDYYPEPFATDYGSGYPCAFCYVFNTESDWCSEFGDCFFEKKSDGCYHRVS